MGRDTILSGGGLMRLFVDEGDLTVCRGGGGAVVEARWPEGGRLDGDARFSLSLCCCFFFLPL